MYRTNYIFAALSLLALSVAPFQLRAQDSPLLRQSPEEVLRKSKGCVTCHAGIEAMHQTVELGCIDCHGGNADATTIADGH
ncbi:MAG: hypothetical protein IH600_11360, partial [Bacteroidetes bacterium]|nr:hypothetical protein [Bacteroidota bacterium]